MDPEILYLTSWYCGAKVEENQDRNRSIFEVAKLKRRQRRGELRAITGLNSEQGITPTMSVRLDRKG